MKNYFIANREVLDTTMTIEEIESAVNDSLEETTGDFGVTPLTFRTFHNTYFSLGYGKPKTTFNGNLREGKAVEPHYRIKENAALSNDFNTVRTTYYLAMDDILEAKKDSLKKERLE